MTKESWRTFVRRHSGWWRYCGFDIRHLAGEVCGVSGKPAGAVAPFFLWIDAVGGYWVSPAEQVILGQPDPSRSADVPILGDLASRHARIRREGEGYLIEAFREVRVDGRPAGPLAVLPDACTIQLGRSVRLAFRRPHALSHTARLEFLSRHRTQPSADAVLLVSDTCVLGPGADSHVICRRWPQEVILYRQQDQFYCQAPGAFSIDGRPCQRRGLLGRNSRIVGDWFSLALEPIVYGETG